MRATRWSAAAAVMLAAACGADDGIELAEHPEVRLDVEIDREWVRVSALEVARPAACNQVGFPTIGTCAPTSDAIVCNELLPAGWIERVELISPEGAVLATATYAPPFAATLRVEGGVPDDAMVRVVAGDGGTLEVPLVPRPRPVPQITIAVARSAPQTLAVGWEAPPTWPHAIVSVDDVFTSHRCHVAGVGSLELDRVFETVEPVTVTVAVHPTPTIVPTRAGLVYLWPRTSASVEYVDP